MGAGFGKVIDPYLFRTWWDFGFHTIWTITTLFIAIFLMVESDKDEADDTKENDEFAGFAFFYGLITCAFALRLGSKLPEWGLIGKAERAFLCFVGFCIAIALLASYACFGVSYLTGSEQGKWGGFGVFSAVVLLIVTALSLAAWVWEFVLNSRDKLAWFGKDAATLQRKKLKEETLKEMKLRELKQSSEQAVQNMQKVTTTL